MHVLFLRQTKKHRHQCQQWRTLYEDALSIKHVRDRGLDHVVEREKHLKPIINIKNLIKSEPSKSIPLNIITQSKHFLQIPIRPIEFLRKYPSIFQEFYPGGVNIHPHVKLTPEFNSLDSDEELLYQSVSYKQDVADRVLKLLMLGKVNKFPLHVIVKLKWDLGLCDDYTKTVVPEYPDYFRVNNNDLMLELVCWSNELAVSFMQKQAINCGKEDLLGKFHLKYVNGFEVDKKYKKWVYEWQKLPYISPYENAMHLAAKSDEGDKWAVSLLHEILSLCVGKKAERDNLLLIGECLGLRGRFKRALMLHPGIFYVSSKISTHTVVLKEGYKRGALVQRNPVMEMRYKYVYLMNKVTEDKKPKDMQQKSSHDLKEGEPDDEMEDEEDDDEDEEDDDVYNDYNDDDTDNKAKDVKPSQKLNLRTRIDDRKPFATSARSSAGRHQNGAVERTSRRSAVERTSRRSSWRAENNHEQYASTRSEDKKLPISSLRTSTGRSSNRAKERTSRPARRPETNDNQYAHQGSSNKSDLRRYQGKSEQRRISAP